MTAATVVAPNLTPCPRCGGHGATVKTEWWFCPHCGSSGPIKKEAV